MPVGARSVELTGLADCRDSLVDADCVSDILWLQLLFVLIRWCYNGLRAHGLLFQLVVL